MSEIEGAPNREVLATEQSIFEGCGVGGVLIGGSYMLVSEWTFRVVNGSAPLPKAANELAFAAALVLGGAGLVWLTWRLKTSPRSSVRGM